MRILAKSTLREFWKKPKHAGAELPLRAWYAIAKKANWKTPNEVKQQFRNASIISSDRVVFNIKGNDYRLVVTIDYSFQVLFVRFIGTHAEYDHINAKEI